MIASWWPHHQSYLMPSHDNLRGNRSVLIGGSKIMLPPGPTGFSAECAVNSINWYVIMGFLFASSLDVDECESQPCLNGAECVDQVANFTCLCPTSFTGALCETGECISAWKKWIRKKNKALCWHLLPGPHAAFDWPPVPPCSVFQAPTQS